MPKYWLISDRNNGGTDIHGAYFVTDATITLMRQILRGIDRGVLETMGVTKGNAWPSS